MPCLTGPPCPSHFIPLPKRHPKHRVSRAFIRGSFKSPFAFSPVYILCIASYSFLSAFRHSLYSVSPCAFAPCFFVSFLFPALLCPVSAFRQNPGLLFLQKGPGAIRGLFLSGYLLRIPVRANRLPFYVVRRRLVLFFFYFLPLFLFSMPPSRGLSA